MRHHIAMINILYNPSDYCDRSWLAGLGTRATVIDSLPAYIKNRLLLDNSTSRLLGIVDKEPTEALSLFVENWHRIKNASYLFGLKILSGEVLGEPSIVKQLSQKEWLFLCLPLHPALEPGKKTSGKLSKEEIIASGAHFIYTIAHQSLPPPLCDRFILLFPKSQRFNVTPDTYPGNSLAALKWAFSYA